MSASQSRKQEFDLLVIGGGVAGLSTAITAAEKGLEVAVLSKEDSLSECNTRYAQGGIIGPAEADSPDLLAQDISYAGDGLGNAAAIRLLTEEGPVLVDEFLCEKIGVTFSKNPDGRPDLTKEAAHSIRRIHHVKDETGEAIETALVAYCGKQARIHSFTSHTAIDLITNTHNSRDPQARYADTRVWGAYVLDGKRDEVDLFFAPQVVLASGGVGNLFLHTSNPPGATGDGIVMAYRIGAHILNAEYVQSHPTILYHRDVKRFLISEAMRGEGARLLNLKGEYFMERYHPHQKDLAPRDEVARAIYREMEDESSEYVLLDARRIEGLSLEDRFPGIFRRCMEIGIDMRREPIPVVPGAHYFCGGIKVNLDGETSIPGLYAVGECACTGVHGANRLASLSLLEGLYWGVKTGGKTAAHRQELPKKLKSNTPDWIYPTSEEVFDPVLFQQDFRTIRSTMWNYAGIIRSRKRLTRALADLDYLSHRIEQFYRTAKLTKRIVELRNSVLTASLIVRAALANHVSQGCHYIE